jgi:hypothetical protein
MESDKNGTQTPYSPSWVDRLVVWIDRLPGPYWLIYTLAMIITGAIINATLWLNGDLPVGSLDILNSSFSFFVIIWVGLYHYLNDVASRALRTFRPLLDTDDSVNFRIEHELIKLPHWIGRLAIPVGFGLALMFILGEPESGESYQPTLLTYAVDFLITGFMVTTLFAVVIRSIRQLRMVNRLHKRATNLNLLNLAPAHAFSSLTARTGIGIIFVLMMAAILDILTYGDISGTMIYILFLLLALAVFILPVIGIKNRIEEEKERALEEVTDLLQVSTERLHAMVRNSEDKGLRKIEKATTALIRERELLKKVSTWPWNPGTVRGFASALLLPIFLLVVSQLLDRLF